MSDSSTPNYEEFIPELPFQKKVLDDVYNNLDYTKGTHELLLSGTVGSGKSLLAAHIIIQHALSYNNAKILIGRRALPDLKDTLFQKLVEHLEGGPLIEGHHYKINHSSAFIEFINGSLILGKSWADKKYRKFRSLELSMAVIEEATENKGDDLKAIAEIRQRLQRQPHIKRNLIIYCTNPDGPTHPLYKYFFLEKSPTRHVYLSNTKENHFLDKTYIEQLRRDMDPKEAQRMLDGQWVEVDSERIYYAYDHEVNFIQSEYKIRKELPLCLAFDFNIAAGKPMSCCIGQYHTNTNSFHIFDEVVIHGGRTLSVMEELAERGYFDLNMKLEIYGDATGRHQTTSAIHSDYDIIFDFLNRYKIQPKLNYEDCVPMSNPPIRERHNIVNAYCLNSLNERRLFVYEKCKVLDEGMRLTSLKEGAHYIEDDNNEYQHITTALGYFIVYKNDAKKIRKVSYQ